MRKEIKYYFLAVPEKSSEPTLDSFHIMLLGDTPIKGEKNDLNRKTLYFHYENFGKDAVYQALRDAWMSGSAKMCSILESDYILNAEVLSSRLYTSTLFVDSYDEELKTIIGRVALYSNYVECSVKVDNVTGTALIVDEDNYIVTDPKNDFLMAFPTRQGKTSTLNKILLNQC